MSTAKDLFTNLARKVLLKDKFCFVCRTYAPENGVCKCPDLATIDSQFAKSDANFVDVIKKQIDVIKRQDHTIEAQEVHISNLNSVIDTLHRSLKSQQWMQQ